MCPNYVFLDALSSGNIPDINWRPTKIVTLLPRPYRGEYLTLPWSESSENIENGISMQEKLLWSRFCASLGSRLIEFPVWSKDSYVWGLVFLLLGVSNSYVWWLVFLRLGVKDSYVRGLVFLRVGVSNSYVWVFIFLRLGVSFLTSGG